MDTGSEFQADRPASTENARSPSLVKVDVTVKVRVSVEEHNPCRQDDAAVL